MTTPRTHQRLPDEPDELPDEIPRFRERKLPDANGPSETPPIPQDPEIHPELTTDSDNEHKPTGESDGDVVR